MVNEQQKWNGRWGDDTGNIRRVFKDFTFTAVAGSGAIGSVPLFTITGQCLVVRTAAYVLTTCVGASGTLAYGVVGSTSLFIAATAVAQLATTTPNWNTTTTTAGGGVLVAGCKELLIDSNITAQVATTDFSAGKIRFVVEYTPFSSDGLLVPV